ncbi:hypothetical protein [Metabacillus mangrovi]|uniref:hypothetical protein n=1 Tax=Metabacillus mangrovi TaxID=1491830 RepID=UPI0013DDCC4E|nr:hypothetical protein [Metabacillus mangrovi]
MGRGKSRRFVHQGKNAVAQHDERIPYHLTMAEAEQEAERKHDQADQTSLGGF